MELPQGETHQLFQQMGEVLSGIRALHETIELRQAQAERLHDLVREDLGTLRHDQRELEEKLECVIGIVQHELEALRAGTAKNARSLSDMANAVDSLRMPIAEILGLKSRIAGLVFGAGMVGSAALWLAEPAYSWFVNMSFSKR